MSFTRLTLSPLELVWQPTVLEEHGERPLDHVSTVASRRPQLQLHLSTTSTPTVETVNRISQSLDLAARGLIVLWPAPLGVTVGTQVTDSKTRFHPTTPSGEVTNVAVPCHKPVG